MSGDLIHLDQKSLVFFFFLPALSTWLPRLLLKAEKDAGLELGLIRPFLCGWALCVDSLIYSSAVMQPLLL